MKLKKLLSLFIILALCLSFAACAAEVDVDVEVRPPDNLVTTTAAETTTTTVLYKTQGTAPPATTARPVTTTTASQVGKPTTAVVTLPPTTTTTTTTTAPLPPIDEDGIYESKEDVALYIHVYGKLPQNFVTKSRYNSLGKPADKCVGGDRFYNREGLLPYKSGRLYYECDIDTYGVTYRGQKRIVYSNDGLIYYTGDHYASFTLLYGTP